MFRQAKWDERLLFEYEDKGLGFAFPMALETCSLPQKLRRGTPIAIPNLSEGEVVRHYTRLSEMNYGVDSGIYPLGSCTMKYTPKLLEEIAAKDELDLHPYTHVAFAQGHLQIMYELEAMLKEIGGVDAVTLQPAAGAQGEFLGMLLVKRHHETRDEHRTEVIIPDTAHGTNPASAKMAGFDVVEIPSKDGCVDMQALKSALGARTAALMLTNPNTLGIFESQILEIADLVHSAGALLYYDGANLNSILGVVRPGDMGFDIVHFNLHKTFGTPHGGGGPGAGPIGVRASLERYLPIPRIEYQTGKYRLDYDRPDSIGKLRAFYGNFNVLVKAYVYIKLFGGDGLRAIAECATLNANYMLHKLKAHYNFEYDGLRKHEFVISPKGKRTLELAKNLLDTGMHPPTIYFPLIIKEALMIEPTESEAKETLDEYVATLIALQERELGEAPMNASVARIDEVTASKAPITSWMSMRNEGAGR